MFGTKHLKIPKSTVKAHQTPNKLTEYKILELKYGNTKLLRNIKYNKVKLVLAVFASAFVFQISNKFY